MEEIKELAVGGVNLVIVVFGLVAFAKSMGLQGRALTAVSMGIGLLFGVLFKLSVAMPVTFADWFAAVVFGLAIGLTACGLYDQAKRFLTGGG